MISRCSSTIIKKNYTFSIWLFLLFSQKLASYNDVVLFLGSLFCFIDLSVLSLRIDNLDYYSFIVSLEVGWYQFFDFVLLFKYPDNYSRSLDFHTNFRICLSIYINLMGCSDCFGFIDKFDILTTICISIHEHEIYLHLFISSLIHFIRAL